MNIINKYKIIAKKSLWQNFLFNKDALSSIAWATAIMWENIVEVWPWFWSLTEVIISKKPKSLKLIELDKSMVSILNDRINLWELLISWIEFDIENIDVLKFLYKSKSNYKVIANIPYYITSPILRYFLYDIEKKPKTMVILMQKDVADKILKLYNHKKPKSSVLSLFIAKKCDVIKICDVSKESFVPAPKVESSVMKFNLHNKFDGIDDNFFLELIKKWFSEPRKKLSKNLIKSGFDKNNIINIFKELLILENTRPEDLTIDKWVKLYNKFYTKT